MEYAFYVTELNIKRLQNLLDTSLDETKRRTIESLLSEEKASAALQASGPKSSAP